MEHDRGGAGDSAMRAHGAMLMTPDLCSGCGLDWWTACACGLVPAEDLDEATAAALAEAAAELVKGWSAP